MRLIRLYAFVGLAIACIGSWSRSVVDAVDRGFRALFEFISRPLDLTPRFDTAGGPVLGRADYDAPSAHFLRHEAGTARRSADRHT